MSMTSASARVIDPILTEVARGYSNADFVGMALFPYVGVGQRGGKVIRFGREAFRSYNTARAVGATTKRVDYGYAADSYALEQHALEGKLPMELMDEAAAVPGIDLGRGTVQLVQDIIGLRLEQAQAALATNASAYATSNKKTLSGTSQWSDHANADPVGDITTAKAAVRGQIGRRPNTVVMGPTVFDHCVQTAAVKDRLKYTGRDVATPDLLAALFGVTRVLVGEAVQASDADVMSDVWGAYVVVAYTELGGLAQQGRPSYGYTYRLRSYPVVEVPYYERQAKSWIYPVTDEVQPILAGAEAGYLLSAVVA